MSGPAPMGKRYTLREIACSVSYAVKAASGRHWRPSILAAEGTAAGPSVLRGQTLGVHQGYICRTESTHTPWNACVLSANPSKREVPIWPKWGRLLGSCPSTYAGPGVTVAELRTVVKLHTTIARGYHPACGSQRDRSPPDPPSTQFECVTTDGTRCPSLEAASRSSGGSVPRVRSITGCVPKRFLVRGALSRSALPPLPASGKCRTRTCACPQALSPQRLRLDAELMMMLSFPGHSGTSQVQDHNRP